ncbi:MAG: FliA/WhiG family RNA polymerase sigma factor [Waddliaceae bacterium]|nr:FliA/WhiG family RNA polymerase sigma factor [Waddliaceae bacterium]
MKQPTIEKEKLPGIWKEYKETLSQELRDLLITNYLPLVKYVVGKLAITLPSHVKTDDLYSTGIIGLIRAVDRYDIEKKNKFETYAILLIKGAIIDEMRSMDWVPRSIHQKANLISKTQEALQQEKGREATDAEVAKRLGMTVKEYDALVERVRPAVMIPMDSVLEEDSDASPLSERIADTKAKTSHEQVDRAEFAKLLEKAIMELPEQERTVLVLYYYENMMLKQIGKVLSVSESRISQVHTKALLRLRGRLQEFMSEYAGIL